MPSSSPSPFVATLLMMLHSLSLSFASPSFSVTSAAVAAPGISCLFAKTNSLADLSSSSLSSEWSSDLDKARRAWSLESMT